MTRAWSLLPHLQPLDTLFTHYMASRYGLAHTEHAFWSMIHAFVCADAKITPEDLRGHVIRVEEFKSDPESARDALAGIKKLEDYMRGEKSEATHTDLKLRSRTVDRFDPRAQYRFGPTEIVILDYVGSIQGRNREHALRRIVRTYMLRDKRIQLDKFKTYIDEYVACGCSHEMKSQIEKDWKDFVTARERLKV